MILKINRTFPITGLTFPSSPNQNRSSTYSIILMRRRGRRKGLKGRRSGWAVVGRVWISMRVAVRGRMGMSRVRRRWPMGLVQVRIILIHHIGAAHHPARARHPRAGLQTCVPERRTTLSNNTTSELVLQLRRWLTPRSDQTFEIIQGH